MPVSAVDFLTRDTGAQEHHHLGWLRLREPLTSSECDAMVSACREFPLVPPATVGEADHPAHRRADTRHLQRRPSTEPVHQLVEAVAFEASRVAYGLDLTGITRSPQYVEYVPQNGHFHRHNDYSHDQLDSPRKITVIVQLSEPDEYSGGALELYGITTEQMPTARGSVVVFPSFIDHCVTPVTAGVRRALVAWVAGPRLR